MILAALALAAATPAAETPQQFMTRAFAQYRHPDFNPLAHPDRWFAPRLIAAINEDSRLAKGEVGWLDGDPVCQCQDPAGMHAKVAAVSRHGASAKVLVTIGWDLGVRPVTFTLVRTRAGWRIADVSSADEPSLLNALDASNRRARAAARR